jgi:hypothetical protein
MGKALLLVVASRDKQVQCAAGGLWHDEMVALTFWHSLPGLWGA